MKVAQQDKQEIVTALLEGIAAAHNAVSPMIMVPFDNFHTYAEAALASLKSAGFKVVRDA